MKRKASADAVLASGRKLPKQFAAAGAAAQGDPRGAGAVTTSAPQLPEGCWRSLNSSVAAGVIARRNRRPAMEGEWGPGRSQRDSVRLTPRADHPAGGVARGVVQVNATIG